MKLQTSGVLGTSYAIAKLAPKRVNITADILEKVFKGTSKERLEKVANIINKYSDKFEINTPTRMAYFLGQVGHETGGFSNDNAYKEATCYPVSNVNWKIWFNLTWKEPPYNRTACSNETIKIGKRKNQDWTSIDKVPKKYVCGSGVGTNKENGINLFSYVYRCEGGNGDEASQEGYKYRGHGFIHLTWKKQYEEFNQYLISKGIPNDYKGILSDPDTAFDDIEIATLSGMWFWQTNKINNDADKDNFEDVCGKINRACDQYDKRKEYTESAKKILKP